MGEAARKHRSFDFSIDRLIDLEALDPELAQLIRRREHSLVSLLELTNELSVSLDPYEIADLVLFNLMGHLGTPKSCLWLLSRDGRSKPVLLRAYGIQTEKAIGLGSVCGPEMCRLMCDREGPLETVEAAPLLGAVDRALVERAGLALFAPVFARTRLLGIVALGNRVGGEGYGDADKQILQCSLGVLGVAVENTSLFSNLAEKNRQVALAYEQLKENDRLKSEFLRNVNHELRTPLTVILAYAQWLLSEEGEEGKKEFLGTIVSEGKKLNGLLEQLLDLSAASADALEVTVEDLELEPVLEQFFMNRHLGITEGLREFRYAAESGLPRVRTDRHRLQQILEAFVDNAIKFTPQGSKIWLEARLCPKSEEPCVRVDVRDDGPGIPASQLGELFVTFHQGDGSTQRTHGGLGIGLPLAKQTAERMGARVEVESEAGQGATFTIVLPVAEDVRAGETRPR